MIARTWRGWTRREDSDAYLDYVERTGGRAARETPGNRGYYILRREDGDRTEPFRVVGIGVPDCELNLEVRVASLQVREHLPDTLRARFG